MMKILIADKFDQTGLEQLKALGCDVQIDPSLGPDSLPGEVGEYQPDVLIVRSTKVPADVFEAAKALSLVIRAGAGYDNINVAAASARGISVANCPGKNSIAVAELAWGLILACDRRIPDQTIELRAGTWNKKEYSKARGLFGRTLGVIGTGQIAQEVITRARSFGMPIVAWSRSLTPQRAAELGVGFCNDKIECARSADIVSVHVAGTPETKNLIDTPFCEALRPGAIFINTSRGSVVDEAALLEAIRTKGVRAGLDVYQNEPGSGSTSNEFASELAAEPGVFGTHHIGASTDQAQQAVTGEAVRIVRTYMETGNIPNVVNVCAKTTATRLLVVRHLNQPGVLAHVIGAIGSAKINIEDMENVIYEGEKAACARMNLDSEPSPEILQQIQTGCEHVLSADLTVID